MTYNKEVTFWCDSEDCDEWVQVPCQTVTRALKKVRESGWSSPEWGEHYCPKCTDKHRNQDS